METKGRGVQRGFAGAVRPAQLIHREGEVSPALCVLAVAFGSAEDLEKDAADEEEDDGGVDDGAGDVFRLPDALGGHGCAFIEGEGGQW